MGIGSRPGRLEPGAHASAKVTVAVVPPVELEDPHYPSAMPIVVDRVTWEHSLRGEVEYLGVHAMGAESFRGVTWHVIAGARELIRDVPAWVPPAPDGWDSFVASQIVEAKFGANSTHS
ncbi:hypothetical protein [Demequina gelatinilytica]|uniref:hypothetical protein n=1 Tax=Demequina gelatinilytica TaxID=1638980 RepID=UPI0007804F22|nr:hypothetical protein [Demequina gelatinilytica]